MPTFNKLYRKEGMEILSEEECRELAKKSVYFAQKNLDNNDAYWDTYWMSLENTLNDVAENSIFK